MSLAKHSRPGRGYTSRLNGTRFAYVHLHFANNRPESSSLQDQEEMGQKEPLQDDSLTERETLFQGGSDAPSLARIDSVGLGR